MGVLAIGRASTARASACANASDPGWHKMACFLFVPRARWRSCTKRPISHLSQRQAKGPLPVFAIGKSGDKYPKFGSANQERLLGWPPMPDLLACARAWDGVGRAVWWCSEGQKQPRSEVRSGLNMACGWVTARSGVLPRGRLRPLGGSRVRGAGSGRFGACLDRLVAVA